MFVSKKSFNGSYSFKIKKDFFKYNFESEEEKSFRILVDEIVMVSFESEEKRDKVFNDFVEDLKNGKKYFCFPYEEDVIL